MLRQIHIYYKGKSIFDHTYALALGDNELNNAIKVIQSYIDMPMPGKTNKQVVSRFQLFHRASGQVVFIFITDLIDHIDYVEKVILKAINAFNEFYPNVEDFIKPDAKKTEFLKKIQDLQPELHSKIAIIGPTNSGKTVLYNLLVSNNERSIMEFAKAATISIDKLKFEVWDFQLKDNFSLLWSKFISGADLIILVFDLSNYHLRVIDHFITLYKQESNLSKFLMIGNKRDLVNESEIKLIKNELGVDDLVEISLVKSGVKEDMMDLINSSLNLKSSLPPDFLDMIKDAERSEREGNFVLAISKYKELIKISNTHQDFTFISAFKRKLEELKKSLEIQKEQRRKREQAKKFKIPDQIRFSEKVKAKPLPGKISGVPGQPDKTISSVTKVGGLKLFDRDEIAEESAKRGLKAEDLKINLNAIGPQEEVQIEPDILPESAKERSEYPKTLQRIIEKKGSSLSLRLCNQLISELEKTLSRPLTAADIKMAAETFVKQEKLLQ